VFGGTTATDDSAHVVNRWAPGVKAGTCTAYAGRLVGGEIVTDATWELVVEPGPAKEIKVIEHTGGGPWIATGDTIDGRTLIQHGWDQYGNTIPATVIGALPDSLVSWTWSDAAHGSPATPVSGIGWKIIVPSFEGWPSRPLLGDTEPSHAPRVHLVLVGAYTSQYVRFRGRVEQ
jgi:hypothetical protein